MVLFPRRGSIGLFATLGLLLSFLAPWPSEFGFGSGQGGKSAQDALRARVQELYGCLQEAKWAKAETYLAEGSRETFRHQDKQQIAGFEIKSIKLEKEDRAEVVVAVPTVGPFSPPIPFPQTTNWRRVRGTWYLELPPPNPNPMATMFSMPKNPVSPPHPVVQELKFETEWFGLGHIQPGKTEVARFPFTNISKHVATIAEVNSGCDCLRAKEQHKEYKPGESGVLEIEFDPSSLSLQGPQALTLSVVVKSSPGGGLTRLTLSGIVPAPSDQQ